MHIKILDFGVKPFEVIGNVSASQSLPQRDNQFVFTAQNPLKYNLHIKARTDWYFTQKSVS